MNNYDFSLLNPSEFENLTRDLLQAEFNIYIESFKEGKDNGIDLRFSSSNGGKTIVQCKRYKDWKVLKPILEKECIKVQKLNPEHYYFVTSVGLSPENKEEIKKIFNPYITDVEYIYGCDDLNNLVGKHKSIERKYYKLWLASTTVLEEILQKEINSRSTLTLETIKSEVTTYVTNDSFNEARDIIEKNKYVIISGIPGIGKTTLARMLIYYLLHEGYEEFVLLGDFNDFDTKYNKDIKQIFFYDDFLGSNYFETGEKNFSSRLVRTIDTVKKGHNAILIMTTREYILSEAKYYYDCFNIKNYDIAKCIIDLHIYTKKIRAQILYNHINAAYELGSIPDTCVRSFLNNKTYLKLINHPNYSPRIIESFIDNKGWEKYPESEFTSKFIESFDNPTLVWENAYKRLSEGNKHSLCVLISMGKEALFEDWYSAYKNFCKVNRDYNLVCIENEWKNDVKILTDCFIKTDKYNNSHIVSLHNPSIFDFAIKYIEQSKELQSSLIQGTLFFDQLCILFKDAQSNASAKIIISSNMYDELIDKVEEMMKGKLKTCALDSEKNPLYFNKIHAFNLFNSHFPNLLKRNKGFLEQYLTPEDFISVSTPLSERMEFLSLIDWSMIPCETSIEDVVNILKKQITSIEDYRDFIMMTKSLDLCNIVIDDSFLQSMKSFILNIIDNNASDIDKDIYVKNVIDDILKTNCSTSLRLVVSNIKDYIYNKLSEPSENDIPTEMFFLGNNIKYYIYSRLHESDDKEIDAMMNGLLDD